MIPDSKSPGERKAEEYADPFSAESYHIPYPSCVVDIIEDAYLSGWKARGEADIRILWEYDHMGENKQMADSIRSLDFPQTEFEDTKIGDHATWCYIKQCTGQCWDNKP